MVKHNSSKTSMNVEGRKLVRENSLEGSEDWVESLETGSPYSRLDFLEGQENVPEQKLLLYKYHQQLMEAFGSLNDMYLDVVSPPFESSEEDIDQLVGIDSETCYLIEDGKKSQCVFPSASLGILRNYQSRLKRLNVQSHEANWNTINGGISSVDSVITLAAERFLQSNSSRGVELSELSHPYASSLLGINGEDLDTDVQLVQDLLFCAEKVGNNQYDSARKLLESCLMISSSKKSSAQRLVYYFTEALYEKIDRETGKINQKGSAEKQPDDVHIKLMSLNPTMLAFHNTFPLSQVTQFSGIQSIIEHVATFKKVHVIDLEIRSGMHFTILMQALAARSALPLERLKITALGTRAKPLIEETGRRLKGFAESLNLNFSFKVVMVEDILDVSEGPFERDAEEAVAVYAAYVFKNLIVQPNVLESLMKVIRNVKPLVLVVTESEVSDNSPHFVNRFVEALFFYGAFFDVLEDCMKHDESNRTISESKIFGPIIRNIVAAEGDERRCRHVSIDIWRACFAQYGMVEIELSMSSIYQANLLLKNFSCGDSCFIDKDGKCLIFGWKGTRLNSVSAWKFRPYYMK